MTPQIPSHIIAKFEKEAEVSAEEAHKSFDSSLVVKWEFIECHKAAYLEGRKRGWLEAQGLVDALNAVKSLMAGAPSIAPRTDQYVLEIAQKALRDFEANKESEK
jgi:hypothetical protein